MQANHFTKAALLTLVIVVIFVASLEYYWRSRGFRPSYNDDKVLWSVQRKKIYKPAEDATVFIGGSRIKFDLDITTWNQITGEEAIQLAIVGTPARLILRDLADDENFKGKVVVDVAETQFFSIDTVRRDKSAREAIEYYKKETPAQRVSQSIDYTLESKLVFLEEGKFGATPLLNHIQLPNRKGVVVVPVFPDEFSATRYTRQTTMTPMFLAAPHLQKRQIDIWLKSSPSAKNQSLYVRGDTLDAFINGMKVSIDKIRSRGGKVVFVRPPSGGKVLENEIKFFPRKKYWDRLLNLTASIGFYFSDYKEMASLHCPEASHLSPEGAAVFTACLIDRLQNEADWHFPKMSKDFVKN